jgi:hypothetical protein
VRPNGVADGNAFAFMLRATPAALTLTVMDRPASPVPGDRSLKSYRTTWEIGGKPAEFIGFYSTHHAGIFLGDSERVHTHAITLDRTQAGHVQDFSLLPGGKLYLPR